ncbi:MAG: ZmpA/ZmpB/ZmpC family metallo-endopeptidase [Corynebacterium sp.]|nr:ZmpA/ZmpB/ZmpC family metallo-endopeptidase [Corynebacterium sp.]
MRSSMKHIAIYAVLALGIPSLSACAGSSNFLGSSLSSGHGSGANQAQAQDENTNPSDQSEEPSEDKKQFSDYISLSFTPDSDVTASDSYDTGDILTLYLRVKDGADLTPTSVQFNGESYPLTAVGAGNYTFEFPVDKAQNPEVALTQVRFADGTSWDCGYSLFFTKDLHATSTPATTEESTTTSNDTEATEELTQPLDNRSTEATTSKEEQPVAPTTTTSPTPTKATGNEATPEATDTSATTAKDGGSEAGDKDSTTTTAKEEPSSEKSTEVAPVVSPTTSAEEPSSEPEDTSQPESPEVQPTEETSTTTPTTSPTTSETAPVELNVTSQWVDAQNVEFTAVGEGQKLVVSDDDGNELGSVDATPTGAKLKLNAAGSTDLHWTAGDKSGTVDAAARISFGHVTGVTVYRKGSKGLDKLPPNVVKPNDIMLVKFSNGMNKFLRVDSTNWKTTNGVTVNSVTPKLDQDTKYVRSYRDDLDANFDGLTKPEGAEDKLYIAMSNTDTFRQVGDDTKTDTLSDNLYLLAPYMDPAQRVRVAHFLPQDSVLRTHAISQIVPRNADGDAVGYTSKNNADQVTSVEVAFTDATPIVIPLGAPTIHAGVVSYRSTVDSDKEAAAVWYQPATAAFNDESAYLNDIYTKAAAATQMNVQKEEAKYQAPLNRNWAEYKGSRLKTDIATALAADPYWNSVGDDADFQTLATQFATPLIKTDADAKRLALLLNWNDRGFRYKFNSMRASTLLLGYRGPDARTHLGYGSIRALSLESRFASWNGLLLNGGRFANAWYTDAFPNTTNFAQKTELWIQRFTTHGTDYSAWAKEAFPGTVFEADHTSYKGNDFNFWKNLTTFNYSGNKANLGGTLNSVLSVPEHGTPQESGYSAGAKASANSLEPQMYIVNLPGTLAFGNAGRYTPQNFTTLGNKFAADATFYVEHIDNVVDGYMARLTSGTYGSYKHSGTYIVWDTKGAKTAGYADTDNPYLSEFAVLLDGANSDYGSVQAYNRYGQVHFTRTLLNNYGTYTHEYTHATDEDAPLFGKGTDFRQVGGAKLGSETVTQNVMEQEFNYSSFAPTFSNVTVGNDAMSAYTPDRLSSDADYKSYYRGLFDTLNLLNYVQGEAFLKLTWEEQQKLGSQAAETNKAGVIAPANSTDPLARISTKWTHLDVTYANSTEQLKLTSLEDLWDNKIVVNPNFTKTATTSFSGSSYSSVPGVAATWYLPHNDYGISDGVTNKYYAFMMAGEAGWQGTKNVLTGKMTDLAMLRACTQNDTIDWKSYIVDGYKNAGAKARAEGKDVDGMIDAMYKAMVADAKQAKLYSENNAKEWNYTKTTRQRLDFFNQIKRETNDFRN